MNYNYLEGIITGIVATLLIAFIVVAWWSGALKDACEDGSREMKENWRVYLFIAMVGVGIPVTLAIIWG